MAVFARNWKLAQVFYRGNKLCDCRVLKMAINTVWLPSHKMWYVTGGSPAIETSDPGCK